MKIYFQLLSFARPYGRFAVPYAVFSLLSIVFGILNFTLLAPLLNVLFSKFSPEDLAKMLQEPVFSPDLAYLKALFNYHLATFRTEHGAFGALQFVCIMLVITVLFSNLFRYLSLRVIEFFRTEITYQLRKAAFNNVASLHLGFFSNEKRGDLISRLTADAQEVESTLANTLSIWLKEPVSLIALFVVLFSMSVPLTLFSLFFLPLSGAMVALLVRKIRAESKEGQRSLGSLLSLIDETLGGLRVVKAFNALGYVTEKFNVENANYRRIARSIAYKRELSAPFSEFTGVLIVAGLLWYGGSLVLRNQSDLEASTFILYILLFSQIIRPAKELSGTFSSVQRGLAAGERVLELIRLQPAIQDQPGAQPLRRFEEEIAFENVSFAYANAPVLQNVSFRIPKGRCVALVGPSGSGKSTIADLIPRFYDVSGGRITLDGTDLRAYQTESLRAQMGIVTQESILFNDTIFNNIAFGMPDASREDVMKAARIANAHEFIVATENGYDSVIGDRGTKLSGGQRQRISIARAVFKNPPILILDEATSALDTESERLVQEALTNLMKDRTSLVIAHRLSTVQHADEILVIHQGEIIERGNHADLLDNERGLYRKLTLMQTS
ncbi:MAG: ABC transporter ATP-binding protein [Ferruginibacter sp.]|nr:ABC transporter ATP-binding protein [Cytophagales bacterium]